MVLKKLFRQMTPFWLCGILTVFFFTLFLEPFTWFYWVWKFMSFSYEYISKNFKHANQKQFIHKVQLVFDAAKAIMALYSTNNTFFVQIFLIFQSLYSNKSCLLIFLVEFLLFYYKDMFLLLGFPLLTLLLTLG